MRNYLLQTITTMREVLVLDTEGFEEMSTIEINKNLASQKNIGLFVLGDRRGSNPQLPTSQVGTLPIELQSPWRD